MAPLQHTELVGALDCGTTSIRFLIFNHAAEIVAEHQLEFAQYFPHSGWHEHDPSEIIDVSHTVINKAVDKLEQKGWAKSSVKVVGITNQRETTVAWDRTTGQPLCNAIVWDDARTKGTVAHYQQKLSAEGLRLEDGTHKKGDEGVDALIGITGTPLSTYFSAIKLRWMIDHHPAVKEAHDTDNLSFGTIDSWIVYSLTGGLDRGLHIIDVTNASRSLLFDLRTLQWSAPLLEFFDLRKTVLPTVVSSSEVYGEISTSNSALEGVRIAGIVGDQQAALVGNKCLRRGEAKNTYGTGAFLLFNTGNEVVKSTNGLISTVAYRPGPNAKPVYALEGSIAVAGSAIKWLRDQIGIIKESADVSDLAERDPDTGGLYFVTAFSGLLAPYWDPAAGGMLIGLTQYTTSSHIARATLEAVAYQTRAIIEAMKLDSGVDLKHLKVDGGMTNGDLVMQIQADIGGFEVIRPEMRESTALGSALLAGSAIGLFGWDVTKPETLAQVNVRGNTSFSPQIGEEEREQRWLGWKKAVERSKGWDIGKDNT
ncbi:hypothetical protein BOTBODRAFT_39646 [Botryobasidium botryosum FD-172 SS1]|uniref:glycerol kinase n=1 Tax=Botryobasidium botryosum (strain FD-172 SS1) TaxID=930990 RepID=A0A067M478_BOTB1|nr:hypothetical protein BOTBODRAFT_39646 [Botryobasidium botryosum FD-172 SS1]